MSPLTVIGKETVIRGDVHATENLEVLGRVEGNVTTEGEVQVGQGGTIVGGVSGSRVVVSGTVEGNIRGTDLVAVELAGRVLGDLLAPSVSVASGAWVRGEVRTLGESSLGQRRSAPRREPAEARQPRQPAEATERIEAPIAARASRSLGAGSGGPLVDTSIEQEVITPRRLTPLVPEAFREPAEASPKPSSVAPEDARASRRPPPPKIPALKKGVKAKRKAK